MSDDTSTNDHLDATIDTGLAAAGDRVDVGDATSALVGIRAAVKQRRHRRQAFSGVAAAAVLGATGLVYVAVAGNRGDDLIVSAPPTDPTVDTATGDTTNDGVDPADPAVDDASDAAQAPDASTVPTGGVVRVAPSNAENVVDAGLMVEQADGVNTQLLPWQGGFLAVWTEYPPQPLPTELPPEIEEQFPPEVLELFPDGLPPTIDEATDVLEEAGLLGVVTDIVVANSDVSDAIYGETVTAQTTVRFSPDGAEWSDIDADFPTDLAQFPTLGSNGERFVVAAAVSDDLDTDGSDTDGSDTDDPFVEQPTAVDVWSSTDLITWEQQTISLPEPPTDLPDFMRSATYLASVTAGADGWLVSTSTSTNLDETALLDDEQRARVENGEVYVGGTGWDDSGVTIDLFEQGGDGSDDEPEVIEVTWEDLGLDGQPEDDFTTTTYAARWGETPAVTDPGTVGQFGFAQFVSVDDGFVSFGSDLRLSPDGVNWSPVELPVAGLVEWAIDTDSGLIVAGRGDDGTAFSYRFDPSSSEFSPVELGELPDGVSAQQVSSGSAVLSDFGDDTGQLIPGGGSLGVIESDGYRFEFEIRFSEESATISYVLTDLATGEVVSTETETDGDLEFEFAEEVYDIGGDGEGDGGREGFRVFDPRSGEELLAIAFDDVTFTDLDADGEPIPETERQIPSEPYEPDVWIVAAVGESLIVEQLDGTATDVYVTSAAVQDDTVLVAKSDGTMIRFVSER